MDGATHGTLLDLLQAGGWPMWLLAGALVAMLYFVYAGLLASASGGMTPDAQLGTATRHLAAGDTAKAVRVLQQHDTVLSRVLVPVLAKAGASTPRAELEARAQANLRAEQALLMQPITYLNMVAAIAPMLGLFGTVWGMIGAFRTISEGGMGNAQLMAGDISMGLITTAAGLLIAIPAVVFHWFLRNRLQRRLLDVAKVCDQLLDVAETGYKL